MKRILHISGIPVDALISDRTRRDRDGITEIVQIEDRDGERFRASLAVGRIRYLGDRCQAKTDEGPLVEWRNWGI